MADWLKSKGLHKLCSVFEGIQEPFILCLACKNVVYYTMSSYIPRAGAFDTWNGPMMGHFNSFSASGEGSLNKNFPKIQMPGGLPGGMFKL